MIRMRKRGDQAKQDAMIEVEVIDDTVLTAPELSGRCKCCPPTRGSDPDRWTDRFPRHPHPSELGRFVKSKPLPTEVTRYEAMPAVCSCNDQHSMIALQDQKVEGKKPHDTIQLWCTLCWRAPHTTIERFKTAWKGDIIKFAPYEQQGVADDEEKSSRSPGKKVKKRVH